MRFEIIDRKRFTVLLGNLDILVHLALLFLQSQCTIVYGSVSLSWLFVGKAREARPYHLPSYPHMAVLLMRATNHRHLQHIITITDRCTTPAITLLSHITQRLDYLFRQCLHVG
jgi:hypothetical protein